MKYLWALGWMFIAVFAAVFLPILFVIPDPIATFFAWVYTVAAVGFLFVSGKYILDDFRG